MSIWDIKEDAQWGELAKRSEAFVDYLTDRGDVAVIILPDHRPQDKRDIAPLPAGCFYPSLARMNIDASQIFDTSLVDLHTIDPNVVFTQKYYPKLVGVLVHESAHARHSTYEIPSHVSQSVAKWIAVLEEIRCENKILQDFPQYSNHIATIVKTIAAKDTFEQATSGSKVALQNRYAAAQTAILVLGRITSGVFEDTTVIAAISSALDSDLGGDLLELERLWEEVFDIDDDDVESLVEVATKISELIDPKNEAEQEQPENDKNGTGATSMPCGAYIPNKNGEPEPATETSPPKPERASIELEELLEELEKIAEQEVKDGFASRIYEIPKSESQKNEERRIKIKAKADAIKPMPEPPTSSSYGYGWQPVRSIKAQPNAVDISRARAITKAIESAHFRDVTRTITPSELPPGRFVIREAMNRQAQVSNRQAITAKPWKQTRRRSVENPPIKLIVLSDISGSMGAYQREVASFTWAMANGVKKIRGAVGALAWNGSGAPFHMIKPNSNISSTIDYYAAGGGSDGLPDAIRAADGLMNLGFGEGVRVMVVITDGDLPNRQAIQAEINLLTNRGVMVLWIVTTSYGFKPASTTVAVLDKPENFGRVVGPKIIEALAKA